MDIFIKKDNIMPKKWINTKSVFEWNKKESKYNEVYREGFPHEGELAHCGCFLAGTKILMSDHSYKNIEDMEIGDEVISWDEANNKIITDKELFSILLEKVRSESSTDTNVTDVSHFIEIVFLSFIQVLGSP